MDKRTVFADGSRAGAVAEGPGSGRPRRRTAARVADARHQRRSEDGHEGIDHRSLRPEARVEQNANEFFWGMDNWMHVRERYISFVWDLKFEARRTPARRMGRHAGRRGPRLSEHQRVVGACRFRADAVFHAQPGAVAHARQLRGPA